MNTITSDYQHVLERVQEWPTTSRLTLIQDIIETINREQMSALPEKRDTLSTALGLLASSDKQPPTDDEVARWLDEHRMEKYGQ
jgi:hypothetical protein